MLELLILFFNLKHTQKYLGDMYLKKFVSRLCGLVLHILLHTDVGFAGDHPLISGQIIVWLEMGFGRTPSLCTGALS